MIDCQIKDSLDAAENFDVFLEATETWADLFTSSQLEILNIAS